MAHRANIAALIVAGGSGARATPPEGHPATLALAKQYRGLGGKSVLARTVEVFLDHPSISQIQVVIGADAQSAYTVALGSLAERICTPVVGGADRQASVLAGLRSLARAPTGDISALDPDAYDFVLVHDAARPLLPSAVIDRLVAQLEATPSDGALAAMPAVDTIKVVDADGVCRATPDRNGLWHAQTPQGFPFAALLAAHEAGEAAAPLLGAAAGTPPSAGRHSDDTGVFEWHGGSVRVVEGARENFKLTRPEDFIIAEALLAAPPKSAGPAPTTAPRRACSGSTAGGLPRIGSGYDVHALGPGNGVTLCGVFISHTHGLVGHSDADVGLHALVDALLGAVAAGDIGTHFPPRDPEWAGAASARFVRAALEIVASQGFRPHNVDLTLVCEAPKVGPHRAEMRRTISELLAIEPSQVSIKATTSEGLGFTGRREGIAAHAHVLVAPTDD